MVQKSDDDVTRALAAFSAPAISYRNFTVRPSAAAEPKQANPPTGGFRLLVAAIPEAAELAMSRELPAPAEVDLETVPDQALPTKVPLLGVGRANPPASALRHRTNLVASRQPAPDHHAPASNHRTPLAAVFSALNADRLPPPEPSEAERKLQNIFSML